MAITKRTRAKIKGKGLSATASLLRERRFLPAQTGPGIANFLAGAAGALVLGIGVHARFVAETSHPWGVWALALGVGIVSGAVFLSESAVPVRVGDAGVALEKGNEVLRIAWCDLKKVEIVGRDLVLSGAEVAYTISVSAHRKAVAWILSEGTRRVPQVMNVKASALDTLPKPSEDDGQLMTIEDIQVAGRRCGKSGKAIVYEREARLCHNCGQVYHCDSVPDTCVTCEHGLRGSGEGSG